MLNFKKNRKLISLGLVGIFLVVIFSLPLAVRAADTGNSFSGIILRGVSCAQLGSETSVTTKVNGSINGGTGVTYQAAPDCTICDLVRVAVNVADLLTGVSGAIALLMFVYGGLLMVLTFVNPEFQRKGIQVMTLTVIGLAIVFFSWTIVNLVILTLTGEASSGFSGTATLIGIGSGSWNQCKLK